VRFFGEHFPEEPVGIAHCRSWLLDPQLAEYLPESNIVAFARRFHLVPAAELGDQAIVRWIFEASDPTDLASLRPVTTLERSVVRHLRAGRHWRIELGWLTL